MGTFQHNQKGEGHKKMHKYLATLVLTSFLASFPFNSIFFYQPCLSDANVVRLLKKPIHSQVILPLVLASIAGTVTLHLCRHRLHK
jgi:hypothetical protein